MGVSWEGSCGEDAELLARPFGVDDSGISVRFREERGDDPSRNDDEEAGRLASKFVKLFTEKEIFRE